MKTQTTNIKSEIADYSFAGDIMQLVKIRLTSMVVFSSVASFLIASSFSVSWEYVILLAFGGFFVAGASNALNEVLEKDYDILMARTQNRPIAAGRMSMSTGVLIAGLMSLVGISLLSLFNPLTGFLGMLSLILYAFVYTPMKRQSSVAVLLGAIPGAMPMLIGCVAYQGYISTLGLTLFGFLFFWQIPHFWAIGFLGFEDYNKAGYKFIPQQNGAIADRVKLQSLAITMFMTIASVIFLYLNEFSIVAVSLMILCGAAFSYTAFKFFKQTDRSSALQLMFGSIIYLPLVLIIMMIDKIF